ncbi:hypothetical protein [Nonomuraea recticatena]|uniref:hypothetical protein n=1 Tax=Nonomuraea recticatena TaxID=46178 RepID=UPI00361A671E
MIVLLWRLIAPHTTSTEQAAYSVEYLVERARKALPEITLDPKQARAMFEALAAGQQDDTCICVCSNHGAGQ